MTAPSVPAAQISPAPTSTGSGAPKAGVSFRRATQERNKQFAPSTVQPGASTIPLDVDLQGSGYMFGLTLQCTATASGNADDNSVAYNEDAPWCAIDTLTLEDPNGQLLKLQGYEGYLCDLAEGQYRTNGAENSTDPLVFSKVTGELDNSGSYNFFLPLHVGTNRRDLLGIVGNQSRDQKYNVRDDVAPSAAVYSTAPTTVPALTIARQYENYSAPQPQNAQGRAQQVVPPNYGTIVYHTSTSSDSAPQGGATVNHYIKRIGKTVRYQILVFRFNGTRANVVGNEPTRISLQFGDDPIFVESYAFRRKLMRDRYGFDWPTGVLIYDNLHDFMPGAGNELGTDYLNTAALVNMQFEITYPSGAGDTNNSLRVITCDLGFAAPAGAA